MKSPGFERWRNPAGACAALTLLLIEIEAERTAGTEVISGVLAWTTTKEQL
jgi:hypothetical protein